jgi:hypothetical protein
MVITMRGYFWIAYAVLVAVLCIEVLRYCTH